MNKFKNIALATAFSAFTMLTGCENADKDFPDYGTISVYFPYQTPVRTLVLGTAENDEMSALDREHKCKIMATMGGSYSGKNITIDVAVDNSLISNINEVKAMPAEYYQLASNQISFKGNPSGGVEVQLTDAFFKDPDAVKTTYVIPMVMTKVSGADQILTGTPAIPGTTPSRVDVDAWQEAPKDYVLYAIKYVNKYNGSWLRLRDCSGAEEEKTLGKVIDSKTPVVALTTASLTESKYSVTVAGIVCELDLSFDASDNCTISTASEGWTVSVASGKFTSKGAKEAWAQKDRDLIELNYTIEHVSGIKLTTKEQLIWQTNGVRMPEEFSYTLNK